MSLKDFKEYTGLERVLSLGGGAKSRKHLYVHNHAYTFLVKVLFLAYNENTTPRANKFNDFNLETDFIFNG